MIYAEFCAARDELQRRVDAASARIKAIPGAGAGPMGLTPDSVKSSPEWRQARAEFRAAFDALRAFNARHASRYRSEERAARDARRASLPD